MKNKYMYLLAAIALTLSIASVGSAQTTTDKDKTPAMPMTKDMSDCPMMQKADAKASKDGPNSMADMPGMNHDKMVMQNGEKAMGFSQTATTHHFLLMDDGGAIQVEVNDAKDTANRDRIRMHLTEIAKQFAEGIFTTPFAVHGKVPDGVPTMDKLKADIKYTYEETPNGARVRIATNNPKALAAIYEFLRFQINEHHTGDPLNLEK